ncbi:MAG: 5-formyltetrahydrofolate cyclo-ligase [Cytophagales bacterium]|nr:5-formyltetrahydrofolate cyclo-ligase [Cytophagales bacterium]
MTKARVRKKYLVQRKSMNEASYQTCNQSIHKIFFEYFTLKKCQKIHIYLPLYKNKEVDTWPIVSTLQNERKEIVISVPKLVGSPMFIQSYQIGMPLKENQWGIQEPVESVFIPAYELDLVVLPLIIFDKRGYRVGCGKGHYDRFLKKCREDIVKVGLCFEAPVEAIEDIKEYDVPMNYCVTPEKVYVF